MIQPVSLYSVAHWLVLIMCALSFSACSSAKWPSLPVVASAGATIKVESLVATDKSSTFEFERAIYSVDDNEDLTILMIKGTPENPQAVLTARMFWTPIPAQTPIDETATNATFHLAQFTTNEEGQKTCAVYAGAGFLFLYNNAGSNKLSAGIWEANLRLADASESYAQPLDQSILKGKIIARKNPIELTQALNTINQKTTEALGYPRFLHVFDGGSKPLAIAD